MNEMPNKGEPRRLKQQWWSPTGDKGTFFYDNGDVEIGTHDELQKLLIKEWAKPIEPRVLEQMAAEEAKRQKRLNKLLMNP